MGWGKWGLGGWRDETRRVYIDVQSRRTVRCLPRFSVNGLQRLCWVSVWCGDVQLLSWREAAGTGLCCVWVISLLIIAHAHGVSNCALAQRVFNKSLRD